MSEPTLFFYYPTLLIKMFLLAWVPIKQRVCIYCSTCMVWYICPPPPPLPPPLFTLTVTVLEMSVFLQLQ